MGGFPPAPPKAPGMPMPPAAANFQSQMSQAESAQSSLEDKVTELEKKLMEEREKVLLAQLRSKEEEAVSAKVETSIKDIQDKLRREKKEQELEEMRRKAEAKVIQMERRLAEEREAWVSTLKGQLNQRDQITQEMESHFSTRLKDLEYRWAQEKSALEASVRDRDAEIIRIRQEVALKSEHDKAFWEDRIRVVNNDREKLEREIDRASIKFQQEKDQLLFERQTLRESVSKLESAIKFVEEQSRVEKGIIKQQADAETETLKKQVASLGHQLESIDVIKLQMSQLQAQLAQAQSHLQDKDRVAEQLRGQLKDEQSKIGNMKREIDQRESSYQLHLREMEEARRRASALQHELDDAKKSILELERGSLTRRSEVSKVQEEYESRMKTLQSRLDWYDANVKREYDLARDKVREEINTMQAQLREAHQAAEVAINTKDQLIKVEEERNALRTEVETLRADWKEVQHEMNLRLRGAEEKIKGEQKKTEDAMESKLAVEQELRQRISQVQNLNDAIEKRNEEMDRLQKSVQHEHDKAMAIQHKMEEYKNLLESQGSDNLLKLKSELAEKEAELDQAKQKLLSLKAATDSQDEKDAIHRDKERVLRQLVTDKEETLTEFKNRIHVLERQLGELTAERDGMEVESKKKIERLIQMKQREIDDRLAEQKNEIEKAHRHEVEGLRAAAAAGGSGDTGSVDMGVLEQQIRQRMESEVMDQLREKETAMDQKVKEINDEAKKESDKWRWENENLKEELRRSREARMQIEREAQELIQQAELHYKGEFEKRMAELEEDAKKGRGFFGTIGKILDTPIIDTNKKKND